MKKSGSKGKAQRREEDRGSRNGRAMLMLTFFLSALFLVFTALLGDKSLFELQRMRMDKQSWIEKNTALAEENTILQEKIQAARKDPLVVEKIAREELGLVRENEVIYLFDPREISEEKDKGPK